MNVLSNGFVDTPVVVWWLSCDCLHEFFSSRSGEDRTTSSGE